jgi:hypothetical protein
MKPATPTPTRRAAPRPARPSAPGTIHIAPATSGTSPWTYAILGILILAAAAFAIHSNSKHNEVIIVQEPEKKFELPKIVAKPETDGERPDMDAPAFSDEDFHFLPEDGDDIEDAEETLKKAAIALEKKNARAEKEEAQKAVKGVVKKEIKHKTPGLTKIPKERVVDVLCVYTTQYKVRYGNKSSQKILKRIENMFRESNEKWQKQGTNMGVRIVGMVELDYYDNSMVNDLRNLNRNKIYTVSGVLTHKLRERLGADMIALFGTKGGGGVSSGNPFFVVKRGHGIFTHECQHAFGWGHGEQLPNRAGDDVSKLGHTVIGRAQWMPTKTKPDTIYTEYKTP